MNVFYIALSTIKRNFRDRKAIIRSILTPIIIIMILGAALNRLFQFNDIGKITVAYLNEDKGVMSESFEKFMGTDDIQKIIEIRNVDSFVEGQKLVTDKVAESFIVLPKGYTEKIKAGQKGNIEIYNSKYKDFTSSIVKNIIESYNSGGNTISAMAKAGLIKTEYTRYNVIAEKSIPIEGKRPRALDYYAVAILVMAIMNSSLFACSCIGEDYFHVIGERIKSTPIKRFEAFLGKLIGCVFTSFLKACIIIAFCKFVYGANFGNNWAMIAIIVLTTAVMANAFGMMVCMIVGNTTKASTIISIIVNVFTFIGGGYAAMIGVSESVSKVMHMSLNFYAQTALFNTIYPDGFRATAQFFSTQGYIMLMWLFSIIMFGILYIAGRRRA